jgi:hypothetical protein
VFFFNFDQGVFSEMIRAGNCLRKYSENEARKILLLAQKLAKKCSQTQILLNEYKLNIQPSTVQFISDLDQQVRHVFKNSIK